MDFSELFKTIKERLANPLFFSFLVSWIFINWEVTVSLLWYNSELYPKRGDLIKYIDDHTSNGKSVVAPILFAILYTIAMPFIKNGINALQTAGGNMYLWLSKGSKIPMAKFIVYKNLYEERGKVLEKVISDESKTIEQYQKKSVELEGANAVINQLERDKISLTSDCEALKVAVQNENSIKKVLESEFTKLKHDYTNAVAKSENQQSILADFRDTKYMNGEWTFYWKNQPRNLSGNESFFIFDNEIYISENGTKTLLYRIHSFFHDVRVKRLSMILEVMSPEALDAHEKFKIKQVDRYPLTSLENLRLFDYPMFLIHELSTANAATLTGIENGTTGIAYHKN
jgi:hypothetical protein